MAPATSLARKSCIPNTFLIYKLTDRLQTNKEVIQTIMYPTTTDNTIIGIQNPGAETAEVICHGSALSAAQVIEQYGAQIDKGAFVSLTDRDALGNTVGVTSYIADRVGENVYLQTNEFGESVNIDEVGGVVVSGYAPESVLPTEPYTVIGTDDDNGPFVAVVTASSPENASDEATAAVLVDAGYEYLVSIIAIFEGDVTENNVAPEAS